VGTGIFLLEQTKPPRLIELEKSIAEALRDQIYDLHCKCFSERQIARALKIPRSDVHYHMTIIRQQNVKRYTKTMDPEGRNRAFHVEMEDQIRQAMQEAWLMYGRAVKEIDALIVEGKHPNFSHANALLQTIRGLLSELRDHIGAVAPRPSEVYLQEQIDKVKESQRILEEKRQAAKVHQLGPQP